MMEVNMDDIRSTLFGGAVAPATKDFVANHRTLPQQGPMLLMYAHHNGYMPTEKLRLLHAAHAYQSISGHRSKDWLPDARDSQTAYKQPCLSLAGGPSRIRAQLLYVNVIISH